MGEKSGDFIMSYFDKAFEHVLGIEGGYVNDPKDPGGETKYGICKRSYPSVDIKALTIEQAKALYKRDYWDKVKGDELPFPINLFMFDAAVNQGVDPAIKMLQAALSVAQDGVLGVQTLKAAAQAKGGELPAQFMAARAMRYIGTRNFDRYGKGWFKRLFAITMEA